MLKAPVFPVLIVEFFKNTHTGIDVFFVTLPLDTGTGYGMRTGIFLIIRCYCKLYLLRPNKIMCRFWTNDVKLSFLWTMVYQDQKDSVGTDPVYTVLTRSRSDHKCKIFPGFINTGTGRTNKQLFQ
jgi:hypothetical protein